MVDVAAKVSLVLEVGPVELATLPSGSTQLYVYCTLSLSASIEPLALQVKSSTPSVGAVGLNPTVGAV